MRLNLSSFSFFNVQQFDPQSLSLIWWKNFLLCYCLTQKLAGKKSFSYVDKMAYHSSERCWFLAQEEDTL